MEPCSLLQADIENANGFSLKKLLLVSAWKNYSLHLKAIQLS
jgi:hypothetical protein